MSLSDFVVADDDDKPYLLIIRKTPLAYQMGCFLLLEVSKGYRRDYFFKCPKLVV